MKLLSLLFIIFLSILSADEYEPYMNCSDIIKKIKKIEKSIIERPTTIESMMTRIAMPVVGGDRDEFFFKNTTTPEDRNIRHLQIKRLQDKLLNCSPY